MARLCFQLWPLQQLNFDDLHNFLAKVGSKFCPKQNKPSLNHQSLLKYHTRAKVSTNLVTLNAPLRRTTKSFYFLVGRTSGRDIILITNVIGLPFE